MYYKLNEKIQQIKITPRHVFLYALQDDRLISVARVNKAAYEIINLCDGMHTEDEIVNKLSNKYCKKDTIKLFVHNYLSQSIANMLIEKSNCPSKSVSFVKVIGNFQTWSPELLTIELTNNCVLRCKHCYMSAGEGELSFINDKLVKSIIEESEKLSIPMIQLTGGEPLLHPHIFEIMNLINEKNIAIQLFTSGYIDSNDVIDKIVQLNNKKMIVQVSLDGFESFHNEFRGKCDAFAKTINFIKKLTSNGVSIVVAMCITMQSDKYIINFSKYVKELGVKVLRLGVISDQGRAKENALKSESSQFLRVVKLQNSLSELLGDKYFKVELSEDTTRLKSRENCGLCQSLIKINQKGRISPCLMSEFVLSDYASYNIETTMRRFGGLFSDIIPPCEEVCGNCKNLNTCNHCIVQGIIHGKKCKWWKINEKIFEKIEYEKNK
ncbi:MAG: radical SAM protein [Eggerthia catenaformis]|nr:radical SAM protein [Eggerthia catenaformis]